MGIVKEEIGAVKEVVTKKVDIIEEYSERIAVWAKDFVPEFIFAMITLFIGLWIIKRIAKLSAKAMERRRVDLSLRTFLKSLIGIGLKTILFIMVAGMLGVHTASFVAILGAAGLAIGLALQGSLANFAGGVLILIFKPYKVGDTIETLGQKGEVKEIQIFNTILITADYRTIILPNGSVSNGFIINHSKVGNTRVDIKLSISDIHPIEQIKTVLSSTVLVDKRILPTPSSSIRFIDYCPGGYVISIKVFASTADSSALKEDMLELIKKIFDEKKIETPRQTSFVKQVS